MNLNELRAHIDRLEERDDITGTSQLYVNVYQQLVIMPNNTANPSVNITINEEDD